MKLHHKTPCKECPWRLVAPQGWMGGLDPSYYTDAVMAGEVPACHKKDHGPESDDTAFCAGALSCMANQSKMPDGQHAGQETAPTARNLVGRNPEVFQHAVLFHQYHTGETWVHPLMRKD